MKIAIIRDDSIIGVDGIFRQIDITDLDPSIYTIYFDTTMLQGNIKYNAINNWNNVIITDFSLYQIYFDRWIAAAPIVVIPPSPIDQSDMNNLSKIDKTTILLIRQYANALKANTFITKTVADTRNDFMNIFKSLP